MRVFHSPKPNQGIGWANMPGDFDRSPSPGERERERGRERERERERESNFDCVLYSRFF